MPGSLAPNTKVMSGGIGGTLSSLIIAELQMRGGITLLTEETAAIIIGVSFLFAYFTKDPQAHAMQDLIDRLKARLDAVAPNGAAPAAQPPPPLREPDPLPVTTEEAVPACST